MTQQGAETVEQPQPSATALRPKAHDCVITAAYGVGPGYVHTFLSTFRAVNTTARMILLVNSRVPLAEIARQHDAELHVNHWLPRVVPTFAIRRKRQRVRPTEAISRTNRVFPRLSWLLSDNWIQIFVPLPVARLFHTRKVLAANRFGSALVCDCRDVLFQSDPFADPPHFELAAEPNVFGKCPWNDKWIRHGFGAAAMQRLRDRQVYCSGTILGSHARVLEHVTRMCQVVRTLRSWRCFGQDQGVHNYIVHNELDFDAVTISDSHRGRIATVGAAGAATMQDGYVVDAEGHRFAIVHQYDRLPAEIYRNIRALAEHQESDAVAGF